MQYCDMSTLTLKVYLRTKSEPKAARAPTTGPALVMESRMSSMVDRFLMMVVVVAGVCAFVVCEKAKRANPQATHPRERKAPGEKTILDFRVE